MKDCPIQWWINNPHKIKEAVQKWNTAKYKDCVTERGCIINTQQRIYYYERRKRYIKWLSKEDRIKIGEIYKKAADLTKSTGIKHEVDHIIPLKGENVSGLHVPSNLRIITKIENRKKYNKFIKIPE